MTVMTVACITAQRRRSRRHRQRRQTSGFDVSSPADASSTERVPRGSAQMSVSRAIASSLWGSRWTADDPAHRRHGLRCPATSTCSVSRNSTCSSTAAPPARSRKVTTEITGEGTSAAIPLNDRLFNDAKPRHERYGSDALDFHTLCRSIHEARNHIEARYQHRHLRRRGRHPRLRRRRDGTARSHARRSSTR